MSKVKLLLLPIFTALIILGSYLVYSSKATRAVARTDLPAVDDAIAFWQNRIAQNPKGYIEYTYLAEAYSRKARETGDIGYYQRSEGVLRQALEINPTYHQTIAQLSGVLFAMHDFSGSLQLSAPLLEGARTPQVLGVYGDAQLALGNYSEAEIAYRQLHEILPSPASYSRLAVLADLQGDPNQALTQMQQALELAQRFGDYPESLAWYEYQVGELYFKSGDLRRAGSHYRAALDTFAGYYLALAGLGKVAAARGDYDQAVDYYTRATEIIPQPELLAALGDVYQVTGEDEKAELQYSTVEYIGKLAAINAQVFNRQLANFYSDHDLQLDQALELSTGELETRKDIYGYDAAAWANYKNGRFDQAQALIEQALQLGTRDAKLYYHAGMIAYGQGQPEKARDLLSEALKINPHFDLLQARIAQETLDSLR
jgi:tetratricopeptide (TPR) repeat protein